MSNMVLLKDLVNIDSGFAFKSSLFTDDKQHIPIIRIRDVNSGVSETYYSGEYDEKYIVNNGDLLISMDGNFIVRKWDGGKALLNQRVCRIKSISDMITDDYLFRVLPKELKLIEDKTPFVTVKHLSVKSIEQIEINLPNLQIQNKIVEVLDKAYELICKRKEQIELLDGLIKSRFIEMFGNVITNSKDWDTELLGEICELKAGKNIKAKDIYEDNKEDLYPCYGGNGLRGYVKAYSHEGRINLIGRQGALCGNVKFATGKFYATEHAVLTQPKVSINSYWLHFVLRELDLNRLSTGAAQPGLTVGKLNEVEIPKVSIELQNQFADFVKQVDKLKFEMENSLKELENNFDSLMQRAFKGELF